MFSDNFCKYVSSSCLNPGESRTGVRFLFVFHLVGDSLDLRLNHTVGVTLRVLPLRGLSSIFSLVELFYLMKDFQACLDVGDFLPLMFDLFLCL